jgi:hypothetical protein
MPTVNPKSSSRSRARIREGNELKLSKKVCRALGIEEGDVVNLTLITDVKDLPSGALILTPHGKRTKAWTETEWRAMEKEASRSIREGRTHGPFAGAEKAIAFLKKSITEEVR